MAESSWTSDRARSRSCGAIARAAQPIDCHVRQPSCTPTITSTWSRCACGLKYANDGRGPGVVRRRPHLRERFAEFQGPYGEPTTEADYFSELAGGPLNEGEIQIGELTVDSRTCHAHSRFVRVSSVPGGRLGPGTRLLRRLRRAGRPAAAHPSRATRCYQKRGSGTERQVDGTTSDRRGGGRRRSTRARQRA